MLSPAQRRLLRLLRDHLDVGRLLAAQPDVSAADLADLWSSLGLDEPPPAPRPVEQRGLFEPSASPGAAPLTVVARCDGAARGNPGPASIGAVLEAPDGTVLAELSEAIGHTTNNVAEYRAVIRAAETALSLGATELRFLLDSDLLVNQLKGTYRVKASHLRPLHERAMALLRQFGRWSVRHVPRSENAAADALANQALDAR